MSHAQCVVCGSTQCTCFDTDKEYEVWAERADIEQNRTIEIRGILLTKVGDDIVVEAWMPDGTYREVIRERAEGPISHCVHAGGIRKGKVSRG